LNNCISQSYKAIRQQVGTQDPRSGIVALFYDHRSMNPRSRERIVVPDHYSRSAGNLTGLVRFSGGLVTNRYDPLNRLTTVLLSLDSNCCCVLGDEQPYASFEVNAFQKANEPCTFTS